MFLLTFGNVALLLIFTSHPVTQGLTQGRCLFAKFCRSVQGDDLSFRAISTKVKSNLWQNVDQFNISRKFFPTNFHWFLWTNLRLNNLCGNKIESFSVKVFLASQLPGPKRNTARQIGPTSVRILTLKWRNLSSVCFVVSVPIHWHHAYTTSACLRGMERVPTREFS